MNLDFSFLLNALKGFFSWLGQFLTDLLIYVPQKIYSFLVDASLSIFDLLPCFCFIESFIQSYNQIMSMAAVIGGINIGAGLVYLFGIFKIGSGLSLIASSLIARFFLRRIPFLG